MFCFAKVFARFDERFQPNKDQFAICTNKKGHYPFWMKYKNASDNLFMCHLAGLEAERVESLTDKEIKKEIEELFRNAFSIKLASVDPTIFRPTAVAVTNWSKNPRFCGSYSYFPVHAFATVREADLTCGLTGTNNRDGPKTFYFAGEALDDKFNGWVQGAYRSGERVAKSIIEDITL
jgi:monoamine oxidase